jgi:hypothetical protein
LKIRSSLALARGCVYWIECRAMRHRRFVVSIGVLKNGKMCVVVFSLSARVGGLCCAGSARSAPKSANVAARHPGGIGGGA